MSLLSLDGQTVVLSSSFGFRLKNESPQIISADTFSTHFKNQVHPLFFSNTYRKEEEFYGQIRSDILKRAKFSSNKKRVERRGKNVS